MKSYKGFDIYLQPGMSWHIEDMLFFMGDGITRCVSVPFGYIPEISELYSIHRVIADEGVYVYIEMCSHIENGEVVEIALGLDVDRD